MFCFGEKEKSGIISVVGFVVFLLKRFFLNVVMDKGREMFFLFFKLSEGLWELRIDWRF